MSRARRAAEKRGHRAEQLAALLLNLKGYRIIERRFRSRAGEIDLVARRGRRLAFVEVKERADTEAAAWSLTPHQQARIARAAKHWLALKGPGRADEMSFDVILVAPWRWPRHIRDAFRV